MWFKCGLLKLHANCSIFNNKQTEDLTTEETHLWPQRKGNDEHARDTHQQLPIQLNTAPSRCEMFLYLNFSRHEFSFQDTFFQIFFSRIFFLICQRLIKAITGVPFLQIARCHLVIGLSSVLWRLMMLYWSVRECGSMGHQRDLVYLFVLFVYVVRCVYVFLLLFEWFGLLLLSLLLS